MAGFVAPIVQGLAALEEFKKRQAAEQTQQEEQVRQNLQEILVQRFLEREGI